MDKDSVRVRPPDRTEADLLAAIREDEQRQGRAMSPSEREGFARGFFGAEYAEEIRLLAAAGLLDAPDEEE